MDHVSIISGPIIQGRWMCFSETLQRDICVQRNTNELVWDPKHRWNWKLKNSEIVQRAEWKILKHEINKRIQGSGVAAAVAYEIGLPDWICIVSNWGLRTFYAKAAQRILSGLPDFLFFIIFSQPTQPIHTKHGFYRWLSYSMLSTHCTKVVVMDGNDSLNAANFTLQHYLIGANEVVNKW